MFFTILAQAEDGPGAAVPEWQHASLLAMAPFDPPDMIDAIDPKAHAGPADSIDPGLAANAGDPAAAIAVAPMAVASIGGAESIGPAPAAEVVSAEAVAMEAAGRIIADLGVLPAAVAVAIADDAAVAALDKPPRIEFYPDDDYDTPGPGGRGSAVLRSRYAPDEFRDAPGAVALAAAGQPMRRQTLLLHVDDVTTATGAAESRTRTLALALDAVLPRSGVTIQPRVQLAYRPVAEAAPDGARMNFAGDDNATGLGVRLYSAQPTRLAGVYPFVEADWWQDSRKRALNINGTRIDADILRGLFSFNVGAHGSTRSGVRIWFKVKGGRNAGGTIGARYRW